MKRFEKNRGYLYALKGLIDQLVFLIGFVFFIIDFLMNEERILAS